MSTLASDLDRRAAGYLSIAWRLRESIQCGELGAGVQLPAIAELARRYGTTAVTARRALRWLEEQGLVRVEHGVGSFVADWAQSYELLPLPSFASEMEGRAERPDTLLRGRYQGFRDERAARLLGLEHDAPLVALARVRRLREVPVAFQRSILPAELAAVVRSYSPDQSLYQRIALETGRVAISAREQVHATALPPDAARELDLPEGAVGWRSERLTFDAADRPLVFDEAFFPAGRVEMRIDRRAGQATVAFQLVESTTGRPDCGE